MKEEKMIIWLALRLIRQVTQQVANYSNKLKFNKNLENIVNGQYKNRQN